jgi:PAS domain S-box-containing protein
MAEQIPGGFFVYHAQGIWSLIYVNKALLRLYACQTEEEFRALTGYTFPGLVHPDDVESVLSSIREQVDDGGGNMDYVEYRIIRRDGAVRRVDDYGHLTHLPGYGDVFYVFMGDITEKHNAMEEGHRRSKIYEGMRDHSTSWPTTVSPCSAPTSPPA